MTLGNVSNEKEKLKIDLTTHIYVEHTQIDAKKNK